jgi:hypothetical protein
MKFPSEQSKSGTDPSSLNASSRVLKVSRSLILIGVSMAALFVASYLYVSFGTERPDHEGGLGLGLLLLLIVMVGAPLTTLIAAIGTVWMWIELGRRGQPSAPHGVPICVLGAVFSVLGFALTVGLYSRVIRF